MKRFALLAFVMCLAFPAFARQRISVWCEAGNGTVTVGGLSAATKFMQSFPSATVSIFDTGTTNLSTIYADNAGTVKANPFTCASDGFAFFYLDSGARVDIKLSGTGVTTPFTKADYLAYDPVQLTTTLNAMSFSATPTFDAGAASIFTMTLTGNVTSSTITNSLKGQIIEFSLCQDATGSRTFSWPVSFVRPPPVNPAASSCSDSAFFYDGTNWRHIGSGDSAGFAGDLIVAGNLLPNANNTSDIGSSTFKWRDLWAARNVTVGGSLSAKQIGGTCSLDGTSITTLAAAITCAGTTGTIEVFPSVGTLTVPTNATIPVGVTLQVDQGAQFSIATGVTLTINGSVAAGPYNIFTYVGTGVVAMPNTATPTVLCNWWAGSDIHVSCQNAVNAMDSGTTLSGNLQIAPGTYNNILGNVTIPIYNNGRFTLSKYGTVLNLGNVSGLYAFDTKETSGAPANSNLVIQGGVINCAGFAWKGGIHLLPTNGITVRDESIISCNSGAGIEIEGSILVNITNTQLLGNKWGIHAFGTKCLTSAPFSCSPTQVGTILPYTPNGIHAIGNIFGNSTTWGVYLDTATFGHANQILNPVFIANDFEANNAAAGAGGLDAEATVGLTLTDNYFEANLAHNIQLGVAGVAVNQGPTITGNWFTNIASVPNNIELINATVATIEGNNEGGNVTSTCFVNQSITANSLYMGINNTFTSSPLCVAGVSATPTGLLGFNQNAGNNNNVFYGRGLINLGANPFAISYDSGPSKLNIQGTAAGGEITDNPTTQTLLTWSNTGAFKTNTPSGSFRTGAVQIDQGMPLNSGGFKHQRGASGCATAASVGATCTTTVTWTTAFADANYTATCGGRAVTSGVPLNGGLTAQVAASVTFQTVAATAAAAQYTNIDCKAVHDNAALP